MKHLLLAVLALVAVHAADAQPESAYYGLSLGNFEYEENDSFGGGVLFGDKVSSYRLMVGYQFMEHMGVEGGYGKTGTIRSVLGTLDVQTEFKMLTIRLLGVLPFDNGVSLLGGLGYADIDQDVDLTNTTNGARFSDGFSSNEPAYYVAAQYNWDRVALRLAFEKYDFDLGVFSDDVDVSETSLSFFYKL